MAISTATMKNTLASAYAAAAVQAALYTTVPGAAAGTEVTGGTYARQTLSWSAPSNGVTTATATFNVPAGQTVVGAGVHAAAGGAYLDGYTVASQAFATAGTYTLTLTFTEA